MKSRILFGALALTATIVVAACGSSNTPTTAPTATSQTTAASTSTTPSTALPNMPMDTMLGTESATSTTDPTPMASAPMAANPGSTPMASIPMADNPGSSPMGTDPMGSMDMGGSDSGTQGLALQVANPALAANQPATLAFKVVAADGSALTHFQVEQTKLLHLILVRSDLTGFQHVHPTMAADGTWTVPVTFANGGTYRVVADFVPVLGGTATARVALTSDLTVAGTGSDKALPAPATTATVDGYTGGSPERSVAPPNHP